MAVSLVEQAQDPALQTQVYQLSPLVAHWLGEQGVPLPSQPLWEAAARYQRYLFRHERPHLIPSHYRPPKPDPCQPD